MTILWTAADAAAATGGRTGGSWRATGVSIDSRTLAPGDLFVALAGDRRDGHAFVADALERGAAAAMVTRRPADVGDDAPLLLVDDTLHGLEALGRAARARSAARVVAVTGSVGKTGTKEALRFVLGGQAPTHASVASFNNHWGVPLSLARLARDARFAVLELGMSHAGEIRRLTRLARPHVAIVTWVGAAHLAFFPDEAAIADAKGEIFEGLEPGGAAILPRDNPHYRRLERLAAEAGAARVLSFGQHPEADWRLLEADIGPDDSRVVAVRRGRQLRYEVGVAGRHWVSNSLAVLAAVEAVGGDVEAAARALASFASPPGRGRRFPIDVAGGSALLVDESYNANPVSMRAAIVQLGRMPGRRLAVLGDMLELGEAAPRLHQELAEPLEAAEVALVFTCGPFMEHLHRALPPARRGAHAMDSASLLPYLRDVLRPGDVLLVKGSLGSRMGYVVTALTGGGTSGAPGSGGASGGGDA